LVNWFTIPKSKFENAVNNYWKLQALDSIVVSNRIPAEEHKKLIDELIENQEIKDILVSYSGNNNINKFEYNQPAKQITPTKQNKQTHRQVKKVK
jgi:acyl CoA:acetate/3-ketoacid CoA transferase alpha subunit